MRAMILILLLMSLIGCGKLDQNYKLCSEQYVNQYLVEKNGGRPSTDFSDVIVWESHADAGKYRKVFFKSLEPGLAGAAVVVEVNCNIAADQTLEKNPLGLSVFGIYRAGSLVGGLAVRENKTSRNNINYGISEEVNAAIDNRIGSRLSYASSINSIINSTYAVESKSR